MKYLVLVGGGACGEYQAGAIHTLHQNGALKGLAGIVGTSVGALNGCAYAASLVAQNGAEGLKTAWASITRTTDVYTPPLPPTALTILDPRNCYSNAIRRFVFGQSFCDVSGLNRIVKQMVGNIDTVRVGIDLDIDLHTRAFNYVSGEVETLGGRLEPALLYDMALASSAIEGLFPPHNGYGDGSVMDNAPIDVALDNGADEIIVVYCKPDSNPTDNSQKGSVSGLRRALRAIERGISDNEEMVWARCQEIAKQRAVKFIHIYPSKDTGSFLDFNKRGLWEMGVSETMAQYNFQKGVN